MLKNIILAGLFGFMVTSLTSVITYSQEKKPIELPPIYVTSPEIPGCDPDKKFPQMVLLPQFTEGSQIQHACELYDRDDVAWAVSLFYQEWRTTFKDEDRKVLTALNSIMIEWGIEERRVPRAYNMKGRLIENPEVVGLAITPTIIWVRADSRYISDTSLIHELVHVALWASKGSPDPDHEGHNFGGWEPAHSGFIARVNRRLRNFSL